MSAETGRPGRCTACGSVLEPGALFCGSCGARTAADGPGAGGQADWVADTSLHAAALPAQPDAGHDPGRDHPVAAPVSLPWSTALGPSGARAPEPVAAPPVVAASAAALPAAQSAPARDAWTLGADVDVAVAPVGRRLLALLLDQVVAGIVVGAGVLVALPALRDAEPTPAALVVPGVLALVLGAGQWIAEAFTGATLGGAALGIRTVSVRTGRPAGLWAVLVRAVVQQLGGLLAGIGVYLVAGSGAWDEGPMQRGWHDKAARTAVLRASYLSGRRRPVADEGAEPVGLGLGRPTVASDPVAGAATVPGDARRPGGVITSVPGMPAPGAAVPAAGAGVGPVAPVAVEGIAASPMAARAPEPVAAPAVREPVVAPEPIAGPVPVVAPEPVAGPVPVVAPEPVSGPATPEPVATREPVAVPPEPAAVVDPIAPAIAEPAVPASIPDSTIPTLSLPGELEHTRVSGWARPEATGTGAALRLSFDTGERVDVTGPGLVGRHPAADDEEWVHLVAIDDPAQSVSKTHLAFWPEADRLVVTDRGSTNGTVMLDPSGVRWALLPGERVVVAAGWSLVLGQRTVRVEAR